MRRLLDNHTTLKIDHCFKELEALIKQTEQRLANNYGNEKRFLEILNDIPDSVPSSTDLTKDWLTIGDRSDISDTDYDKLLTCLQSYSPWRKGPFDVFGIRIDTEWASNIKWNRIINNIGALSGRNILDIGCSSGYYMFRMLEHNPSMVLGIDPQILFYYQFKALQKFIQSPDLYYIPVPLEDLPIFDRYFHTVFCMGILYHRRSPVDTLIDISKYMKKGGELIIETLIIEGDDDIALFPVDRYAKMRNVYFIPTVKCLESWLKRAKFEEIQCIDISKTTLEEQRKTEWINTESLEDFLNPDDTTQTVEGYPAPVRAVIKATCTT